MSVNILPCCSFLLQFWDDPWWWREPLSQDRRQHYVSHSGWKQWGLLLVHLQSTVPQPLPWVGLKCTNTYIFLWVVLNLFLTHWWFALFTRTAQASCLVDEPKQIGQYKYPEQLPGQLYDADTQCKWQFGSKAKLCGLDFVKVRYSLHSFYINMTWHMTTSMWMASIIVTNLQRFSSMYLYRIFNLTVLLLLPTILLFCLTLTALLFR